MSDDTPDDLVPERPREAGVPEAAPESLSGLEGAHLLANEARERLQADGFDNTEIDAWAEAFFAEQRTGTADDLIAWIAAREQDHTT